MEKYHWFFVMLAVLCLITFGAIYFSLILHENGHAAACRALQGEAATTYEGLGGRTSCIGLTADEQRTYDMLSAAHEMYTYEIEALIGATTGSAMLLLTAMFIMTDIEIDALASRIKRGDFK